VFRPAFTALCDECGTTTMWTKANRIDAEDEPVVLKGFKCSQCDTFEERVLDTRGTVHSRDE